MWELDHDPTLPAGYRGLRGAIVLALKKAQPLTVLALADRFAVTPNGLRRHLKQLEDDGIVAGRREARGVGAPAFSYVLTHEGEALFPRAYAATLVDAIDAVRAAAGEDGVASFFRSRWERLTADAAPLMRALPLHERVQLLGEVMSAHGYMTETEVAADAADDEPTVTLRSYNCPLRAVAERFPAACAVEAEYLAELLDARVERLGRIVDGCTACAYRVTALAPAGSASGSTSGA